MTLCLTSRPSRATGTATATSQSVRESDHPPPFGSLTHINTSFQIQSKKVYYVVLKMEVSDQT